MKKLVKGLVVAGTLAAPMLVMAPAQAVEVAAPDAPGGALTCTTTYEWQVTHNPNGVVPTYGLYWVNATGTVNYALYDVNKGVTYAVCVAI